MTSKPILSKQGQEAQDARRRRQAEALRANLARRKAQDRALSGPEDRPATHAEPAAAKGPVSKPGGA